MKFKVLSLILAMLMVLSCVVSCSKGGDAEETDGVASTTVSTPVSDTEVPKRTWDDLEKIDMGGEEFTILTREMYNGYSNPREWDATGITGDIINDAVFERNSMVEEAYNCTITQICDAEYATSAVAAYLSDMSNDYDMIYMPIGTSMTHLNLQGYSVDLAKVESIDITDTCYDQKLNDAVSLAGRYYSLSGDLGLYDDTATYTVLFNKTISRENNLENHYDVMLDGRWTYELMYENAKAVMPANPDPSNQTWGIGVIESFAQTSLVASGNLSFNLKEDGNLENNMKSSKYIDSVFKIFDYWKNTSVTYVGTDSWQNVGFEGCVSTGTVYGGFAKGKSLYCTTVIAALVTSTGSIYNSEEAFGLLPVPKLDDDQEGYGSVVDPGVGGIVILGGHTEITKVGHILTAMSFASSSTLVPAFYEQTLLRRAMPDEESIVTLELILNDRVADLGYLMSASIRKTLRETFGDRDGSCNYESLRKKYADSVEDTIDEIMEAIRSDFAVVEDTQS